MDIAEVESLVSSILPIDVAAKFDAVLNSFICNIFHPAKQGKKNTMIYYDINFCKYKEINGSENNVPKIRFRKLNENNF